VSDTYQAVFDAVRSRISGCNIEHAVSEHLRSNMDFNYAIPGLMQDIACQFAEHGRPSAVFRPKLSIDGNQWCALPFLHDGFTPSSPLHGRSRAAGDGGAGGMD
jgi:hypothetical protein